MTALHACLVCSRHPATHAATGDDLCPMCGLGDAIEAAAAETHAAAVADLARGETREQLLADAARLLSRLDDIANDPALADEDRAAIGNVAGSWCSVRVRRADAHAAVIALERAEAEARRAAESEEDEDATPRLGGTP